MTDRPRKTLRLNMRSPQYKEVQPQVIPSPAAEAKSPEEKEVDALALVTQAIKQRLCLNWAYNGTTMEVDPQVIYLRKDSLYCDAVVTQRNATQASELKLGSFRLSGLQHIALIGRTLRPWPGLDLADARYGVVLTVRDDA
ncbi:hypothetical protein PX554_12775 [Sphingomonas sp. H39-1-10]|jgi:hypothetical protein|uniref:hypothetical protein n=1 Tax=Sphingomonas pollutisoli TaxID=3030829 RepID=UPI0023B9F33A|nr:hypothetical protein [Sphingomonas pollutisoli]MDF0489010.1 hypothetical protein [Sphingomonas pollutisoli]